MDTNKQRVTILTRARELCRKNSENEVMTPDECIAAQELDRLIATGSAVVIPTDALQAVIAEMRLMASEGYDVTQTKLYGWIGELERLARGEPTP